LVPSFQLLKNTTITVLAMATLSSIDYSATKRFVIIILEYNTIEYQ